MERGRSFSPKVAPITTLAGGVGAAKFIRGLVRRIAPERLTVVVNTGDAVIVAAKSHAQDIRRIAEAVKRRRADADGAAATASQAGALDPAVEESLADIVAGNGAPGEA